MTFSRDAFSLTTQKSLITDKIKKKDRLSIKAKLYSNSTIICGFVNWDERTRVSKFTEWVDLELFCCFGRLKLRFWGKPLSLTNTQKMERWFFARFSVSVQCLHLTLPQAIFRQEKLITCSVEVCVESYFTSLRMTLVMIICIL